jgi:hypothetical protein
MWHFHDFEFKQVSHSFAINLASVAHSEDSMKKSMQKAQTRGPEHLNKSNC